MLQNAASENHVRILCSDQYSGEMPLADGSDGWNYNFFSIEIPQGYAIQYIQFEANHSWYGCGHSLGSDSCYSGDNHQQYSGEHFYFNYSKGSGPENQDYLYGGWSNLTIDYSFKFYFGEQGDGYGFSSVWPSSEYFFTLYYRFVPVIPVE